MSSFRSVLSIPGSPRLFASALIARLPQYALVSRVVTPGSETEAFTWAAAALLLGLAAGSAAGGAVISSGGVGAPFELGCAATATAALLSIRVNSPVRAVA
jgi:predicted MFS family arabinose efflux permease